MLSEKNCFWSFIVNSWCVDDHLHLPITHALWASEV